MPVKKKAPARRKAPVKKTMAAPGPMAAKDVRLEYKKRKKFEVQAWYQDCLSGKKDRRFFAITFGKKSGIYGNPERLVVVYSLDKGSEWSYPVGVVRYSYGNGLQDVKDYLNPTQWKKFHVNDHVRMLDSVEFSAFARFNNLIKFG